MTEKYKDYKYCIDLAIDNAKRRINLIDDSDKKCVFDEYREWINEGLIYDSVLLLREDPII